MMTKEPVDVSVVAANYNNAKYLPDFFNSFIQSTVSPKELIFVDDGSTDNSLTVASTYLSRLPCLKIVPLETNRGFGNALNAGITLATGKYILRIDPDDAVMPARIEQQVAALETGEIDVVGSNAEYFHAETGRPLGKTNFPLGHNEIYMRILKGEHGVLHPTVMAKRELFVNHPYIQSHVPAEDYDIFARFIAAGAKFSNIGGCLTRYRVHVSSASNKLPVSTIEKTFKIRDEIFSTHTSQVRIYAYYMHIKMYRKYLFSRSKIRFAYAAISSLFYPSKVFSKLLSAKK